VTFVDTGAWFSAFVTQDSDHAAAETTLDHLGTAMVTTDYIIDETLTLLRARGHGQLALEIGKEFFAGRLARIIKITETDIEAAWQVFNRFADKTWSFTDCTSKIVIERLNINTAFTFDHHFRQFGSIEVVPA
jgi:predicted nucleic acid-binding protein